LANLNGRTRHRVWGDQSALTTSFVGAESHHLSHRVDTDPRTKTIVQISTSVTEERDEVVSFNYGFEVSSALMRLLPAKGKTRIIECLNLIRVSDYYVIYF
jgi:hypothetical protein